MLDTIPAVAEKLWSDYILTVGVIWLMVLNYPNLYVSALLPVPGEILNYLDKGSSL